MLSIGATRPHSFFVYIGKTYDFFLVEIPHLIVSYAISNNCLNIFTELPKKDLSLSASTPRKSLKTIFWSADCRYKKNKNRVQWNASRVRIKCATRVTLNNLLFMMVNRIRFVNRVQRVSSFGLVSSA